MTTQNLSQINDIYYFRTRIPLDLRLWFHDRQDFKRSLKTNTSLLNSNDVEREQAMGYFCERFENEGLHYEWYE